MRRILILLVVIFIMIFSYASKPDDKICAEIAVKAVWGKLTPEKYKHPEYYEQFMNLNYPNVVIKDFFFFKHVKYKNGKKLHSIAIGAFKRFFYT